jgi:transposase-like protein
MTMRNAKRARYTLEFKREAVRLVESGQSIAAAARSLGKYTRLKRKAMREAGAQERLG